MTQKCEWDVVLCRCGRLGIVACNSLAALWTDDSTQGTVSVLADDAFLWN